MLERGLPSLGVQAFNRCRSEGPEGNTKALMMYRVQGPQNVFFRRTIYDTAIVQLGPDWGAVKLKKCSSIRTPVRMAHDA
ncbi:hypothetical protein PoB_007110600 [Plakobranchus ocellatus]|uniref:Uncharacterized protein n=1 Tax=Plakobranchus ocellatus TaxID=259542 RepID=A0AAV4DK84_9GAST|nr:hypothetical protein PoB_007110600 [Plakobranchus ocellatus]